MIICYKNQTQVVLQVSIINNDGTSKTNIDSSLVRVYRIIDDSEVDDLASVSLVQVSSSNIYRYVWEPTSLAVGQYQVEYTIEDTEGNSSVQLEELSVLNVPTWEEFNIVKQIEVGRWKIASNQMIIYEDDGVTELLTFNLYDLAGRATNTNVMERVPV